MLMTGVGLAIIDNNVASFYYFAASSCILFFAGIYWLLVIALGAYHSARTLTKVNMRLHPWHYLSNEVLFTISRFCLAAMIIRSVSLWGLVETDTLLFEIICNCAS